MNLLSRLGWTWVFYQSKACCDESWQCGGGDLPDQGLMVMCEEKYPSQSDNAELLGTWKVGLLL